MKVILLFSLLLLLAGCPAKESTSSVPGGWEYSFAADGCITGEHKTNELEVHCTNLKNHEINHFCAFEKRKKISKECQEFGEFPELSLDEEEPVVDPIEEPIVDPIVDPVDREEEAGEEDEAGELEPACPDLNGIYVVAEPEPSKWDIIKIEQQGCDSILLALGHYFQDSNVSDVVRTTPYPINTDAYCEFGECLSGAATAREIVLQNVLELRNNETCLREQYHLSLNSEGTALIYNQKSYDNHRSCNGDPTTEVNAEYRKIP